MGQELLIREVFRFSSGRTVLACEGATISDAFAGRQARLVVDGQPRQSISLASERSMLNQTKHLTERAFETFDSVNLELEEVQNGRCRLVLD